MNQPNKEEQNMKRFSFKMFAIALTIAALFLFASCDSGGGGNGDETASDGVNTGDKPPVAGDVDDGTNDDANDDDGDVAPGPHYTGMDRAVIELHLASGISNTTPGCPGSGPVRSSSLTSAPASRYGGTGVPPVSPCLLRSDRRCGPVAFSRRAQCPRGTGGPVGDGDCHQTDGFALQ